MVRTTTDTPVVAALFLDQAMAEPEIRPFLKGFTAFFSAPAPDRTGPNQDAAVMVRVSKSHGVFAVADGAGGLPGGDKAAAIAVQKLESAMRKADPGDSLRSPILDAFELANQAILDLGTGAATTLAVVEIRGNEMRTYHAGDSQVLVTGQRGKVKVFTVGHSPVSYGVEAGVIDEREALHHEDLNIVSNFLGQSDMRIEVGSVIELAPRDTICVASDGLFDNLHVSEVIEHVRAGSLEKVVSEMVSQCRQRMEEPAEGQPSKPDDLTLMVFRLK